MKNRSSILVALMLASVIGMVSSGATLALTKIQGETINKVTVASVKGQIVELYEQNPTVYPGSEVDKVVNVKNTGEIDSAVRIKVSRYWGSGRDDLGALIKDSSLSTDNILIEYNTAMWQYDSADGYYYYKGVLTPGETTAQPLITGYSITDATGNEYKGKTADIVVAMECVQAGGNGISSWGKTFEQLGVEYSSPAPSNTDTDITFNGSAFSFGGESGDLFADFKGLIPGESRSQTVTISNTGGKTAELWLKASATEQPAENSELIDKLIKEYLIVNITDSSGKLIYSGPVWGNIGTGAQGSATMESFISLGDFAPGGKTELTVSLAVSSALDNEYQSLLGNIKWNLEALNEETTTAATTTTTTTTTTTSPSDNTTTTAQGTPGVGDTTVPSGGIVTNPSVTGAHTTSGGNTAATTRRPSSATDTSPGTTARPTSSHGEQPDIRSPVTGSEACYIVFFVSAISFIISCAAYLAGRKEDRAGA